MDYSSSPVLKLALWDGRLARPLVKLDSTIEQEDNYDLQKFPFDRPYVRVNGRSPLLSVVSMRKS